MTHDKLKAIRALVSSLAIFAALASWWLVSSYPKCNEWITLVIVVWSVGPPIWFACESWLFDAVSGDKPSHEALKRGQELATKFWAGIAAALFAIHKLYA
jgi:hypothetical protein